MNFNEEYKMLHSTDGNLYYFDRSLHLTSGDHPEYYQHLLATARESIDVWDPYFHNGDDILFNNVSRPVNIRLLREFSSGATTSPNFYSLEDNTNGIINNMSRALKGQGKKIICAFTDKFREDCKPYLFHDRYLIIDKSVAYAVGSSLSYQHTPEASFGIYKIVNIEDVALINSVFDKYLNRAKDNNNYLETEY